MYVAHCKDSTCSNATATTRTHIYTDPGSKIAHSPAIGIDPNGKAVLGWQESLELFAIGECADVACTTVTRRIVDLGGELDGYDHFVPSSMQVRDVSSFLSFCDTTVLCVVRAITTCAANTFECSVAWCEGSFDINRSQVAGF